MQRSILLVLLLCCGGTLAQQTLSPQDAGSTVLARMATAAGWQPGALPRDVSARGTVSILFPDGTTATHNVTFTAKDATKFKWEHEGKPNATTVSDMARGLAFGAKGQPYSAQAIEPWHFPFLTRLLQISGKDVRIAYLGVENVPEPAYKVQITREPGPEVPRRDEVIIGSPLTVWVSVQTFLPVQISYLRQSGTNRLEFLPYRRTFSDYRSIDGLLIPFHQEEWFNWQHISTLEFTNVVLNTGISDRDFTVNGGR